MINLYENELIVKNNFTKIYRKLVGEYSDEYLIVDKDDAVTVVVKNENNEYLVVEQFRVAANQITFEFVQGSIEKNEDKSEAAKRELLEEAGIILKKSKYIGYMFEAADWCTTKNHVVLCESFEILKKDHEFNTYWLTENEILNSFKKGQFVDSPSLSALTLCLQEGKK